MPRTSAAAPPLPVPAGGFGHNSGATLTVADLIDPETLTDQWALDHRAVTIKTTALLDGLERLKAKLGPGGAIGSDETNREAVDFAKQMRDTAKALGDLHTVEKAPFLNAGRAADAFFVHGLAKPLQEAAAKLMTLSTAWMTAEAARKQRQAKAEAEEAEAAANVARQEAAAAEAAARRTQNVDVIDNAERAQDMAAALQQHAVQAQRTAAGPIAEFSRVRGDRGGVSSLSDNWVFRVVAFDLVPREYLSLDESKVRMAIRRKDMPVRQIPGLEICNEPVARLRG